jgi:hypothetical protein
MDYNEYDDYGTGWEEAAEREYDRQEEAGVEAWRVRDAAARRAAYGAMVAAAILAAVMGCDCEKSGTDAATDALLSGRCDRCGWRA